MKILYVITSADLGGAQKSVLLLAQQFGGAIAAGTEKSELFTEAEKLNIPNYRLKYLRRGANPIFDCLALVELYLLIKKLRPDIVHLNSSKAGFSGSIAGKLAGAKVVYTARGFVFNEPLFWPVKFAFIGLEKFASIFRDQIITVSHADQLLAKKFRIISRDKIITINNAVPQISFIEKSAALELLNLDANNFNIVTVANFYPPKGLDTLILAINNLPEQIENRTVITIVGDGPQRAQLERMVDKFGLQNRIRLPGQIPNIANRLSAFDLFVLPSNKEGFPLTLLEALQAGLPIIATDVGGNAELLETAGILVPSGSPQSLAQAISSLVENKNLRLELAAKARERSSSFTLDQMFGQTEQVYEKIYHRI